MKFPIICCTLEISKSFGKFTTKVGAEAKKGTFAVCDLKNKAFLTGRGYPQAYFSFTCKEVCCWDGIQTGDV